MATVRLSDVVVPEVFNAYMAKDTMVNTRLWKSGVLRPNPKLSSFLAGGGRTCQVPFWNDLDNTPANISSDDPSSNATPLKVTASRDICIRHNRNQSWQDADLVAELAGSDPMQHIKTRVMTYWEREKQRCLIAALRGVFADNIANDAGDMVYDVAADLDKVSITDADRISSEAIIDCTQTMGDAAAYDNNRLKLLVMHSVPFRKLQKLNLIDYIPDSEGKINFPTYLGYEVLVSDQVPAIAGTNQTTYWTFLLGAGAFCYDEHPVAVPTATDRSELAGDGAGVETLTTRQQWVMHPHGIKFTDSSVAGQSPTDTEYQNAANWDRVYPERKQINMALLRTNG